MSSEHSIDASITIVVPREVARVFDAWATALADAGFPGFELADMGAVLKLHGLLECELDELFMESYNALLEQAREALRRQMGKGGDLEHTLGAHLGQPGSAKPSR